MPGNILKIPPSTSLHWSPQSLEHRILPSFQEVNLTKIPASFSVTTKIVYKIKIKSVLEENLWYQRYKYSEEQ